MKNLKQTTLSFATLPKKGSASTGPRQPSTAPSAASSKSHRPGTFIDYVEIPQPTKRIPRTKPATGASSTKAKLSPTVYAEPRKPSLKRKLLSTEDPDTQRSGGRVQVPRIRVDLASSPGVQSGQTDIRMRSPSSSKKRRLSVLSSTSSELTSLPTSHHGSSVNDDDMDDIQCVPTSQSDEQELVIPRSVVKDVTEVQESVSRWKKSLPGSSSRRGSVSDSIRSGSPLTDIPMDEDYSPFDSVNNVPGTTVGVEEPRNGFGSSYPQTPSSPLNRGLRELANSSPLCTPIAARNTQQKSPNPTASPSEAFCSLTPPPSDEADEPMVEDVPVVEVLDEMSKTARLIADIKARARAAAHSSPEQGPIDLDDFSDLSSSSSDEEDGFDSVLTRGKGKATGATPSDQAGSSKPPNGASLRYNLRRSSPPRPKEKMVTPITQARKPRKADPLGALLREKEREERTGTGMAAVRLADETLAKAKESLRDEMEDEEDRDSDAEIDVTPTARGTKGKSKSKSLMAGPSRVQGRKRGIDSVDEDAVISTFNFQGLLGKDGQDVKRILASDIREKMAEAIAKRDEVPLGVPFWIIRDGGVGERDEGMMDVEPAMPPFTAEVGGYAIRRVLKEATACNDVMQVSALLRTGFVASLSAEQYPVIVPWLFDLAFSDINSTTTSLAYKQLLRLGPLVGSQPSGLRLSTTVLTAVVRLGISPDVLAAHGWADAAGPGSVSSKAGDFAWRAEMTYRLVSLLKTFAQSLVRDELSDIVLLLTRIAMDSTTSDRLQTEVRKAIDKLSLAMAPAHEFATCAKIVAFGKLLTAPNQFFLVSMIPSTSLATIRMSRYIARSFLLDAEPTALQYSDDLPTLAPLVDLLSPKSGSKAYFDIVGNSDKDGFYDDLTFRISLLGTALSDIDEYTIIEKQATQEAATKRIWDAMDKAEAGVDKADEEEKEKEKEVSSTSMVERVKNALDKLHGKIVDTRAAHLERSRAKAALQRLAYRIHYQRVAALKSGVNVTRPRNLLGYFQGTTAA